MSINVANFRSWVDSNSLSENVEIEGEWPDLLGHIFLVAPFHRPHDCHLFAGEGVIYRWDLQAQQGKIRVQSKKLDTWDSFWHSVQGSSPISELLPEAFFPARIGLIGVGELANTATVNLDGRLLLTADAGRYWEIDPITLETITPVGYFDEHIVSLPLSFFPLVVNTAHPFYDREKQKLISCQLKTKPRLGNFFADMVSAAYITLWDGEGTLKHWELAGTVLDGSPHTTIVTEKSIMIPDMPFQIGAATLLGAKMSPQKAYPKTQLYTVNSEDLDRAEKKGEETVPSRLITFDGDSYHFLCNYRHIEGKIYCVAVQQATISVSEAIKPDDVKHFNGDRYSAEYCGIPWMFAFDPGVLRKVIISEDRLVGESAFIHPGWFSTTLHTADPREQFADRGYSAIYQAYAGYHRDLICRRQYLSFRDRENRILTDDELPNEDLPSVLAKVPWDKDWQELTEQIKAEQAQNPDLPVAHLGKELLDFYVFPLGCLLDSVQFIPHGKDRGYIFATIIGREDYQVWLFDAQHLSQGAVAKLNLPKTVNPGFTLHSDYFAEITPRKSNYNVNRPLCAMRSLLKVPYEFFVNRSDDILNRKVN